MGTGVAEQAAANGRDNSLLKKPCSLCKGRSRLSVSSARPARQRLPASRVNQSMPCLRLPVPAPVATSLRCIHKEISTSLGSGYGGGGAACG